MIKDIRDFNKPLQQVIETPIMEPKKVVKVVKKKIEKEIVEPIVEPEVELRKEDEPQQESKKEIKQSTNVNEVVDNTEKDEKAILENRIKELEEEKKGKESEKKTKKIRKKFKVPFAFKKLSRKANKNPEYVMVQYLSLKKEVSYKVCLVVSGNILVIGNKVYTLDPEAVWKYKKNLFYIIREMDRKPISNLDYNLVKERRDETEADVPLLKAVFGATNKSSGMMKDKNILVWVILGAVVIGGLIMFSGGAA